MSRAFTKERDDTIEVTLPPRDRAGRVYLTAAGRSMLDERLAHESNQRERERLQRVLETAVIVAPPEDRSVVAFGATVEVDAASIGTRRFTIVGEDEADIPAGRVSQSSPLGQALLGARIGQTVEWHRPAGDLTIVVRGISYEEVAV